MRWAVGIAAVGVILGGAPVQADDLSTQRRGQLREIVEQDCGSCHGMTLKGGLGSPLLPEDLSKLSAEAVVETILEGRPGTPMPPWKGMLSRDDARWIAAFLMGETK
ncbi:Cytochrome c, mono-and diheme variants (fragment) [Candidatus Terasakiella magnetica]